MINNHTNRVLTSLFLGLFSLVLFSAFASAELNLGINAHMGDLSANFRAVTDPDSSVGYDGFDLLTPSAPSDPSSKFFSTVAGNELAVDSWPASANPRILNLTYVNSPQTSGNLILTWSYSDTTYKVILNDYGSDDTRTNVTQSIDMSKQSIINFPDASGTRYFSLEVTTNPIVIPGTNPAAGGGSGGSGTDENSVSICSESNICIDWSECQNLDDSLKSGAIIFEDYSVFKADCAANKLTDKNCGYQTRECNLIPACQNIALPQSQYCQYVKNPSCNDRIKNCHDGKCEVLTDCGGPCGSCGSCSNGIKDRGEDGIDCGGVCSKACPGLSMKDALTNKSTQIGIYIGIIIILLGILIAFVAKLIRIVSNRKSDNLKWYNL